MRNRVRVMCKPGSVGDLGGQPPKSTRPKKQTPRSNSLTHYTRRSGGVDELSQALAIRGGATVTRAPPLCLLRLSYILRLLRHRFHYTVGSFRSSWVNEQRRRAR